VARRLASVRRVVAIAGGKGGVGKSLLTANLAAALATDAARVGVLDADIHGPSAALMLGARGQRPKLGPQGARPAIGVCDVRVMSMDLLLNDDDSAVRWRHYGGLADDTFVWRGTLEANVLREFLADTEWGELEYLLIDMPPGADRFETLLRLLPELSGAAMVTTPSEASLLVVRRAAAAAQQSGARILGLVENMAATSGPGRGRDLADDLGIPFLASVPFDPDLARNTEAGRPGVLIDPRAPGARAILELAHRLKGILA
ncbi:MAG TPA: P-loop NTPase, partial [Anaerolineales bacterium]|nr:P-loop NTPase [Anaerolineales bacterium]